jgi:hypothetical protein
MLRGVQKEEMILALAFLGQYRKNGQEFLNHFLIVTDDGTSVSFVTEETKE